MSYRILTDTCSDLPRQMLAELDLDAVPLSLLYQGQTYDCVSDEFLKEVYDGLRSGKTATTAAANPQRWREAMEPVLKAGEDLLVPVFSSGLSTTYQSALIAAGELAEEYPGRTVRVVDTLSASLGQGLLVWYACKKRAEGMSLEKVARWVEENRLHLCHWFTVDDLMYLKRGGRIGSGTALVGTMLGIKPVLHMDNEGHLVNVGKARGRHAAIDALVAKMKDLGRGFDNNTVFISHGDCLEDALYLEKKVKQELGVQEVIIGYIGAVIGSHSGPGTLALFFLGKER